MRSLLRLLLAVAVIGSGNVNLFGGDNREHLAATPPMGWNSWDSYGTTVREDQVKANAEVMSRSLAKYGWKYIVVDIQWYEPNAQGHQYKPGAHLSMDEYGRLVPALNRFPSSTGSQGFKPLADYIHSKGLKFGIHIMRGIPRQAVAENRPIKGTKYHAPDIADRESSCKWNSEEQALNRKRAFQFLAHRPQSVPTPATGSVPEPSGPRPFPRMTSPSRSGPAKPR